MTQQEQDAAVGRLVREVTEKNARIGALRAELCRIGHSLSQLGDELVRDPEHATFEGQAVDVRYITEGKPAFQTADINAHRLMDLTNDLRSNLSQLDQLNENARRIGIG